MDTTNIDLKQAVIKVLQDYIDFLGNDANMQSQLIIDENNNHYLLVENGWEKNKRIYGTLIHVDIIDDKIWIQQDGTEEGIANELVKFDIPHHKIVLAYKSPERRKITDFAIY